VAEIVKVEELFRGWARFCLVTFRLEDGTLLVRSVEDHGSSAVVLPYDPERRMALLVSQMRPGVALAGGTEGPEPPAGIIEAGETGEACARREAEEETGLHLRVLEPIGRFWSSPGSRPGGSSRSRARRTSTRCTSRTCVSPTASGSAASALAGAWRSPR